MQMAGRNGRSGQKSHKQHNQEYFAAGKGAVNEQGQLGV